MFTRYHRRRIINSINLSLSLLTMVIGLGALSWILWTLLRFGIHGISLKLFTEITPPPGSSGGLINAIFGSIIMSLTGTLIGTPIGIMAGTYLSEFGQRGILAPITRFINDVLLSAPSIVIGLFVYEVFVVTTHHFSGWAGSFALALLVIPVVVRTTEDMLRLVPDTLREAAAALGAPRWKVVSSVIWKASSAGMITGVMLAFARITGETAPLLFTALNNQFMSTNMNAPMSNLPVVIFQMAMSPYDDWHDLAWAGALLITTTVLLLSILARVVFKKDQSAN